MNRETVENVAFLIVVFIILGFGLLWAIGGPV